MRRCIYCLRFPRGSLHTCVTVPGWRERMAKNWRHFLRLVKRDESGFRKHRRRVNGRLSPRTMPPPTPKA